MLMRLFALRDAARPLSVPPPPRAQRCLKSFSGAQRPRHAVSTRKRRPRNRSLLNRHSATSSEVYTDSSDAWQGEIPEVVVPYARAGSSKEKLAMLLKAGRQLAPFLSEHETLDNRVMGCTTRTYLLVWKTEEGTIEFSGTSDSGITKGLIDILVRHLSGADPDRILNFDVRSLSCVLSSPGVLTVSRSNGYLNLVETLKRKTRMLFKDFPKFPSLVISADEITPQGAFAEAQAQFLEPDETDALSLAELLREHQVGVCAHFYMDPEVQGMLSAASTAWPHIFVSDSLAMSHAAIKMVEAGCKHIAVLGVDFMSENVRAILDREGLEHIQVYRMSSDSIGCSLAEAADTPAYLNYLSTAAKGDAPTMHVVYINTSLRTKAQSQLIVPTITCTSSNVVNIVLQAFAQVENLRLLFGPDTYMGQNLAELFTLMSRMTDEEIKQMHPSHDRASIKSLLGRFEYFKEGSCIVHHLFGGDVCQTVKGAYGDAYMTAHFEVPGEMFKVAMEAKKRGMGVVGSTSHILGFITATLQQQITNRTSDRLQFVLGTESGMITSIVNSVKRLLNGNQSIRDMEVEIVFPVASKAITTEKQKTERPISLPDGLPLVPGPAVGDGCSAEGGCANCPYMKMNTLEALKKVVHMIGAKDPALSAFTPQTRSNTVKGRDGSEMTVQEVGCIPISEMRYMQQKGQLSPEFVQSVIARTTT